MRFQARNSSLFIVLVFMCSLVWAGDSTWVTRTGVPVNGYEEAVSIAVDKEGNVFVTGNATGRKDDYDFLTVKYNANGDTVWTRRYVSQKKNGYDRAIGVSVDDSGNSYVVGYSENKRSERVQKSAVLVIVRVTTATVPSDFDAVTIKYSVDGDTQWVKSYSGQGGRFLKNDIVQAFRQIDDGSILVAGMTNHSVSFDRGRTESKETYRSPLFGGAVVESTTYKIPDQAVDDSGFYFMKMLPTGEIAWNVPVNEAMSRLVEMVTSVATGSDGSHYMIGTGQATGTGYDYVVAKFSAAGESVWVTRYNGPRSTVDVATAIAVDDSGYIYVTGESQGVGTKSDFATIRYNKEGVPLWTKRFDYNKSVDSPVAIAVDKSNNIYVTGSSAGQSIDIATVKYNKYGGEVWVKRYDGPAAGMDKAIGMATDDSGYIYVTGRSLGTVTGFDFVTVKYSPAGEELWVSRFDGQKDSGADGPNALAVDQNGNVYVCGTTWNGVTNYDFLTVKYGPDGRELWVKRLDGTVK